MTWLYPLANLGHVLGAAFLVGGIAVFDVLVLCRRYREAPAAGRAAIPLAGWGIVLLAATGPVLFSAEATAIAVNPVFQLKMALLLHRIPERMRVLLLRVAGARTSRNVGCRPPPGPRYRVDSGVDRCTSRRPRDRLFLAQGLECVRRLS